MSDAAPALSYSAELRRKALHLIALLIPLFIVGLGREGALWILVPGGLLALGLDVARQRVPTVRKALLPWIGPIMRAEEMPPPGAPIVLNGAVWMGITAVVCAVLFSEPIAAAALAMQMVGDGAAAVVGRRWGRTRYPWSRKTLEGSLALFASALLIGWVLSTLPVPGLAASLTPLRLAVGALAATMAEAAPIPVNDNFRVPVAAALAMALVP